MYVQKVNNEGSEQLTARLKQEGRWKLFLIRRKQLEEAGIGKRDSWGVAAKEFPPPGVEPVYRSDVPDEGLFSGALVDVSVPAGSFGRARIRDVDENTKKQVEEYGKTPVPALTFDVNGELPGWLKGCPRELIESFRENQAFTPRKDLEWAHLNACLPEPRWDTCPSAGALNLFRFAKTNEAYFFQLFKNFLPTQKETNAAQRLEDDGRDIEDLIDRVVLAQDSDG